MQITHFYIIESQMVTLSYGMTNRRQITVDSVWIDRKSAAKYVAYMKSLHKYNSQATIYKIKKLKIHDVKNLNAFTGRSMTVCFNHDSVSQYGDIRKDEYYSLAVASGHLPVSSVGSVNKTYYEANGEETLAEDFFFFTNRTALAGTPLIKFWDICQGQNL